MCVLVVWGNTSVIKLGISDMWEHLITQQTRYVETMMFQCWASVEDVGPTLKHHCFNVACLLGSELCVDLHQHSLHVSCLMGQNIIPDYQ